MAKVKNHNGEDSATADGFTKFYFSGTPPEQFEERAQVGDQRIMTVTVECKHSGYDGTDKGVVHQTKWKVINAEIGKAIERPQGDPELDYESGADGQYSETYGTGQPVSAASGEDAADVSAESSADVEPSNEETGDDAPDEAEPEPEDTEDDSANVHQFPRFSAGEA